MDSSRSSDYIHERIGREEVARIKTFLPPGSVVLTAEEAAWIARSLLWEADEERALLNSGGE